MSTQKRTSQRNIQKNRIDKQQNNIHFSEDFRVHSIHRRLISLCLDSYKQKLTAQFSLVHAIQHNLSYNNDDDDDDGGDHYLQILHFYTRLFFF